MPVDVILKNLFSAGFRNFQCLISHILLLEHVGISDTVPQTSNNLEILEHFHVHIKLWQ